MSPPPGTVSPPQGHSDMGYITLYIFQAFTLLMRLISEQTEGKSDLVDVPTPRDSIPPPRDSIPTPRDSIPTPRDVMTGYITLYILQAFTLLMRLISEQTEGKSDLVDVPTPRDHLDSMTRSGYSGGMDKIMDLVIFIYT